MIDAQAAIVAGLTREQAERLLLLVAEDEQWRSELDFFPAIVGPSPLPPPLANDRSREIEREEIREALGRDA